MCATKSKNSSLQIIPSKETPLSPEQDRFNKRAQKLEKLKDKVDKARGQVGALKSMMAAEISPIEEQLKQIEVKVVERFAHWRANPKGFSAKEQKVLEELIVEKSQILIEHGEKGLIPLFNQYSDISYDDLWNGEVARLKEMFYKEAKEELGIELNLENKDFNSVEEFMVAMMKQMKEQQQGIEGFRAEQVGEDFDQKSQEEARNISKVVKTAYNGLVKKFHPDLADGNEDLAHRNSMMHRITEAYEQNDLFELLRLQMEADSINISALDRLPTAQLSYYNQILLQQIKDLEAEYYALKHPLPPYEHYEYYMSCRSHKTMLNRVQETADEMESELEDARNMLSLLEDKRGTREILDTFAFERNFKKEVIDMLNGFGGDF